MVVAKYLTASSPPADSSKASCELHIAQKSNAWLSGRDQYIPDGT